MAKNDTLTYEEVAERIHYDPFTGAFTWLKSPRGDCIGKSVGGRNDSGYWIIGIRGHDMRAHRVAYLLMTKEWPKEDIDHINGDRSDNRWENLRPCSRSQNHYNRRVQRNSKTGIKNISIHQGRYRVELRRSGRRVFDESFDCLAAAVIAAQLAQIALAGEFARHSYSVGG